MRIRRMQMKLDHIVINVNKDYQTSSTMIDDIRKTGLIYDPKKGKGTSGFKVSNIWIGKEYFEMVNVRNTSGGGWIPKWTELYNFGHRGMICLMIDTDELDSVYTNLLQSNIFVSTPKWLEFKWFFSLFTRRMPWRNLYLPFFHKVPFQIGFQQMKDSKSRDLMNQFMIPNSQENNINGITKIEIFGKFCEADFDMIKLVFKNVEQIDNKLTLLLDKQAISFHISDTYYVNVYTDSTKNKTASIHNLNIKC